MPEISDADLRELEALREAERGRRGEPEPKSGALHVYALTQGPLLRYEYDLSTHGHWDGWEVGAVIVDIRSLITVNQAHGFAVGDAVLRAVAQALMEAWPTGKVVRLHADAFAVLLPPSSEVPMSEALEGRAREALAGRTPVPLEYTVSLLHLTIARPSHWQVLGPLVWAECERAHVLARSGQAAGVQRRRVELDAAVPLAR